MHAGRFDGFQSVLSFLPDVGIGCVVLSNLGGENRVPHIAAAAMCDMLLGEEPEGWFEEVLARPDVTLSSASVRSGRRPPPSHPTGAFVGRYAHAGYSDIEIGRRRTRTQLTFALNGRERPLRQLHHNVFLVLDEMPDSLADARIIFGYDLEGRIDRLGLRPCAESPLLWFRRLATE
jgi:hypothetical protein